MDLLFLLVFLIVGLVFVVLFVVVLLLVLVLFFVVLVVVVAFFYNRNKEKKRVRAGRQATGRMGKVSRRAITSVR